MHPKPFEPVPLITSCVPSQKFTTHYPVPSPTLSHLPRRGEGREGECTGRDGGDGGGGPAARPPRPTVPTVCTTPSSRPALLAAAMHDHLRQKKLIR